MATVFVEARPKGKWIEDYVVEDHADHVLATLKNTAWMLTRKVSSHPRLRARRQSRRLALFRYSAPVMTALFPVSLPAPR